MDWHTPIAEVDANRHPVLPESERYQIARCVYDFDAEGGESSITLTLVHRQTGDRRRLRFAGVSCSHPLAGYYGLYIVDTSYRQWERRVRVEVGEFFEDGGVYFLAESVEEIPAEPGAAADPAS
jgi:hypothetical protein